MHELVVYARLEPGSRWSFVSLLAQGWRFADSFVAEPMIGHHGAHSVLMVRPAADGEASC